MTRAENLLVTTMEECNEISFAISKLLRFGANDDCPSAPREGNVLHIWREFHQLEAMFQMLKEERILYPDMPQSQIKTVIQAKKSKVNNFIEVSKELGRVKEDGSVV